MWDIRGWKRLAVHDDPPLVAARNEFMDWLEEAPQPHQSVWRIRLTSDLDDPHFSVRLELFLHHYFKERGGDIEIEPEMSASPNRPDFRVSSGNEQIIVEAKAILDQQETSQQNQRLVKLADQLGGKLSGNIVIHPLSNLPGSILARPIISQIERCIRSSPNQGLEFEVSDTHQGISYSLKVIYVPEADGEGDRHRVEGMITQAHTLNVGERLRDALEKKAGKYGQLDIPFVIAISGEYTLFRMHEDDALFGDRVWQRKRSGPY